MPHGDEPATTVHRDTSGQHRTPIDEQLDALALGHQAQGFIIHQLFNSEGIVEFNQLHILRAVAGALVGHTRGGRREARWEEERMPVRCMRATHDRGYNRWAGLARKTRFYLTCTDHYRCGAFIPGTAVHG